MPGPEQRKLLQEAKRQKVLRYLRDHHNNPVKQRSGLSRVEKSANVSKPNTTTAARARSPSPIVSSTKHTAKAINNDKMPINIYNPSTASPKRKAGDIDDGLELDQGGKLREGRVTKKAKLTSGYVPGTGKPYRGTARERPNPSSPASIGALRDKPANVLLKRREAVAKQDTKNLNRNAPEAKRSTRTSRPSPGALKVVQPEAIDDGTTKSGASKAARIGNLGEAQQHSLQAAKRKRGHDLQDEPKKKVKMDASTASPPRELQVGVNAVPQHRTSSFFMHIQKPGNTAAVPTNVKHVQEVVKKPTPKLPKTPQKAVESPIVKEAEAEARGKKRQRDGDAEVVGSKKAKLSAPGHMAQKSPSIEDVGAESPKGLENFSNACFGNAGLQCLFGVPELVAHYEASGKRFSGDVLNMFVEYHGLMKQSSAKEKRLHEIKEQLRTAVEDKCFIGARFTRFIRHYREAEGDSANPRKFLQACGLLFRDEQDRPLNGDTQQETAQFINELLNRLHDEEIMERTERAGAQKSSFIQKLFHVEAGKNLLCKNCGHTRDLASQPVADSLALSVVLPTSGKTATLGELLEHTKRSELLEHSRCEKCDRTNTTTKRPFFKKLPKYLIVQAPRARHIREKNGSVVKKIDTPVMVPAVALDLSSLLMTTESSGAHQYEVFGIVEHRGDSQEKGHYVAFRKIQGNWHLFDDENVKQIHDEDLTTQGQIFFLRRRD